MQVTASFVLPFTLENLPIRGKFIRLDNLMDEIPSLAHATPAARAHLFDLVVGVALLLTDFKDAESVTLQIQDPETHGTLAVHGTADGTLKAYANDVAQQQDFSQYVAHGALFALSSEQHGETYQSLIPLEGATVHDALVGYFTQSVQAATLLRTWQQDGTVVGLFVQALPEETDLTFLETHQDDWQRMQMLLDTMAADEMTDAETAAETLIYRLFHEDGVRVYDSLSLTFSAANPREKMLQALLYVGADECERMLQDGPIVMRDDYTGLEEVFTAEDIAALFQPLQKPH